MFVVELMVMENPNYGAESSIALGFVFGHPVYSMEHSCPLFPLHGLSNATRDSLKKFEEAKQTDNIRHMRKFLTSSINNKYFPLVSRELKDILAVRVPKTCGLLMAR